MVISNKTSTYLIATIIRKRDDFACLGGEGEGGGLNRLCDLSEIIGEVSMPGARWPALAATGDRGDLSAMNGVGAVRVLLAKSDCDKLAAP